MALFEHRPQSVLMPGLIDKHSHCAQIVRWVRFKKELAMKRVLTVTALAALGFAPAIALACEDYDATSASATPAVLAASAPAPSASKAPAPSLVKSAPKATKSTVKVTAPASDQKLVVGTTN
jgi:imidazolonepropionase-like amidohydrolase